jgi:tRNA threonylcarbamoyladenosine biosynthesis protein TsaE
VENLSVINEADMLDLGARLGRALKPGDTVALIGGLGAGKTTLARGLVQSVLPHETVPSPTYTLVQTYDVPNEDGGFTLWHCDLYRLEHPDEAYELGLMDVMGEDVCLIEWPDRLGALLPDDALTIKITFEGEGRRVGLTGWEGRNV